MDGNKTFLLESGDIRTTYSRDGNRNNRGGIHSPFSYQFLYFINIFLIKKYKKS